MLTFEFDRVDEPHSVLTTRDVFPVQTHLLSSSCAVGTRRSWSNALYLDVSSVFCEQWVDSTTGGGVSNWASFRREFHAEVGYVHSSAVLVEETVVH